MARIIRTLWFRERRWLEEPVVTLPFVGDVEPRRLLFYGLPAALIALLAGLQAGHDWLPALILAGAAGLTVTALAPECRAWCPEERLLALILGKTAVGKRPPAKSRAARERHYVDRVVARVVVAVEEPVRLEGVAVSPTGEPLVDAVVALEVDGRRLAEARTDSSGRFSALLYLKPGHHLVCVLSPDGAILYERRVVVEPGRGTVKVMVWPRSETLPCSSGYHIYWLSDLVTVEKGEATASIPYTAPVGTVRLEADGDAWMGLLPSGYGSYNYTIILRWHLGMW